MKVDSYGDGCQSGHIVAQAWLNNPKRSDPSTGGTLQYVILELADRYSAAKNKKERDFARGEIVGFSYYLECPQDALICHMVARKRDRKGGAA